MSIILTYDHFPCPPTWVINFNTRVLTCNLKLDSSREYIFEVQRNPLPTHVSKVSTCHEIPLPTHLSEALTSHSGVLRWAKISLAHFWPLLFRALLTCPPSWENCQSRSNFPTHGSKVLLSQRNSVVPIWPSVVKLTEFHSFVAWNVAVFKFICGESFNSPLPPKFPECNRSDVRSFFHVRWWSGPWQTCSATCGKGMSLRSVLCIQSIRNDEQKALSENQCREKKPVSYRSCFKKRCPPTWIVGSWTKVSWTTH